MSDRIRSLTSKKDWGNDSGTGNALASAFATGVATAQSRAAYTNIHSNSQQSTTSRTSSTLLGPQGFTANDAKTVRIYSVGKKINNAPVTWGQNLSSLITGLEGSSSSYLFGLNKTRVTEALKKGLNVNNAVSLLLESPPSVKFTVGTEQGFTSLITDFMGSSNSESPSSSKGGVSIFDKINAGSALVSLLSGEDTTSGVFNSWALKSPTWDEKQTPFDFSLSFSFKMGQYRMWSAKEEVVKPLLNLIAPVMNQQLGSVFTKGPFPTCFELIKNCIKDLPEFMGEFADSGTLDATSQAWENFMEPDGLLGWVQNGAQLLTQGVDFVGTLFQTLVLGGYKNYTYNVEVGDFVTFNRVIYDNAEVSWGKETDEEGFPISGKATIHFTSLLPPAFSSKTSSTMFAQFNNLWP